MAEVRLPEWFREARGGPCPTGAPVKTEGFLDKNLETMASFMSEVFSTDEYASRKGLLQSIEPGSKTAGIIVLIVSCSIASHWAFLGTVLVLIAVLTGLSRLDPKALIKRVLPSAVFTFFLAGPVFLNLITPGTELFGVDAGGVRIGITKEGVRNGLFFMTRVIEMVTLAALLVLTTRHADFFRGLRKLPIPSFFVTALFLTFRYLLILLKIAEDATLARRSRTATGAGLKEAQQWFASRVELILRKSLHIADEVNMAMASRGFSGQVKAFHGGKMAPRDFLWLGFTFFVLIISFRA